MCDCFHLVLPNWPGSPASVSGRQLRPEDPDAETEEDNSVTEVPIDEIIRPRPQGSSPVYEYSIEEEHFGRGVDIPTGRFSSGRRKSRWKRDSGESQSFSQRSQSEEPMEVTLQTDVEAGASGYSVTGGGKEGIFVKQVLKDSSAAKLFSMREGDQLLSATIYFDNIKYEDALKILQYSEPYKVQFSLKRKLALKDDTEKVDHLATSDVRETDQQGEGLTGESVETSEKILEEEEDREKLIVKPRTGRSQWPKKERLSWPKFQAKKPKKVINHRRSHSTSDACEGRGPDISPTSTDTELHFPKDEIHLKEKKGSEKKRKFLNIGFRMHRKPEIDDKILKAGSTTAEVRTKTSKVGQRIPLEVQDPEMELGKQVNAAGIPEHLESGDNSLKLQLHGDLETKKYEEMVLEDKAVSEKVMRIPASVSGKLTGPHVSVKGRRKKIEDVTDTSKDTISGKKHVSQAEKETTERFEDASLGVQGLEIGIAKLTLQESQDEMGKGYETPEIRVKIPTLQTPKFGFSQGKVSEGKLSISGNEQELSLGKVIVNLGEMLVEPTSERDVSIPDMTGEVGKFTGKETSLEHTSSRIPDKGTEMEEGKAQLPSMKMSQVNKVDVSSPRVDITIPSTDMPLSKTEGIIQDTGTRGEGVKMEGDIKLGDKDVEGKDTKFKMPKFKMPSFGWSPSKEKKGSGEVFLQKGEIEVSSYTQKGDEKGGDSIISLQSTEISDNNTDHILKIAEEEINIKENKYDEITGRKRGKTQMPSIKIQEGYKEEIQREKVEVEIPIINVSQRKKEDNEEKQGIEKERVNVEGDVRPKEKESDQKESKFRIPRFSMPGFGWGGNKDIGSSVDIETSVKEAQMTVSGSSVIKDENILTKEEKVPIIKANVEVSSGENRKVQVAKVKTSIKKPKMQYMEEKNVTVTMPSVDVSLHKEKGEMKRPEVQTEGIKEEKDIRLGEKDVEGKDSKFKMPKFKMPSFGVSTSSKEGAAFVEVALPKDEVDVSIPSLKEDVNGGDLSVEVSSMEVDVKGADIEAQLQEGDVEFGELKGKAGSSYIKGHLAKGHMPSIKIPKADIKAPKVDITMPSVDVSLPKGKVDIKTPEVNMEGIKVEGDIRLGDKDSEGQESKFKIPKFKMPSFGVSPPSKEGAASIEVALPKTEVDVSIPSIKGDVKCGDLSLEVPTVEEDVKGVNTEAQLPEGEVEFGELKGKAESTDIKGYLPKVHMPSIKMPKMPKADVKSPKVDVSMPSMDMSMTKGKLDITSPEVEVEGIKVEGDIKLGDKDKHGKESKFKMPKIKMPSFGVSSPSKEGTATVEVDVPKAEVDVSIPSLKGDVKGGDLSVEVPSVEVDLKVADIEAQLPEGKVDFGELKGKAGNAGIKGHLPKVQMPSIKMPKGEIKAPKADITIPSVDLSLPKGKVDITSPEVEVEGVKVEGDIRLGDKDAHGKDSKFKMPKFKMPSFGVSAPSKEGVASVEEALPKAEVDVSIPSLKGDVKISDLSVEVPSVEVDIKGADIEAHLPQGEVEFGELKGKVGETGIKGHLPKMHMPSIKIPQKPISDIKGPKVDITMPSVDVSMPKGKVDIKSPEVEVEGIKVEGDIKLGEKDMHGKDSKFKMPKFKMPSFGLSAPSKEGAASVEVALPKSEVDVSIPSLKGDVKGGDLSMEVPSVEVDLKGADIEAQLPEGEVDFGELKEKVGSAGIKGHLPKVHMPSIKMPKGGIKAPKADITIPSVDLSMPKCKVDIKSPEVEVEGVKVEGDIRLGDKDIHGKDSKFKMPKFKMPSFGVSAPSKEGVASVEEALPKAEVDESIPSLKGDVKISDLSVEVPSVEVDIKGADIEAHLPQGEVEFGELKGKVGDTGIKGHLPKMHMPSIKIPQKPMSDIKGPKVDITMPSVDVSMPKGKVDIKSPEVEVEGIKVEGDMKLGEKDMHGKDSKFKMPKFKMPSFGLSAPSKEGAASVEVALPKSEVDMSIPSLKGDVKGGDLSMEVPSVEVDLKGADIEAQLPEGEVDFGELKEKVGSAGIKGHLPKVHMPSIKMPQMPKADIKGPKVDITMPSVDVSLPKAKLDITSTEAEVEGVKVEGDIKLGDKDMHGKDSKFKMPKFKMPSFGVCAPSDEGAASMEVALSKAEVEVSIPSLKSDVKSGDLSLEELSVKLDVKGVEIEAQLPEGEVEFGELKGKVGDAGIKGYLPKMHMPSIKTPQMPTADIQGPKKDITMPSVVVSMPKSKADIKSPEVEMEGINVEGDMKLGEKDMHGKDSKFKMPKFKMPSFGLSAPNKEGAASVEVALSKAEEDVSIPSLKGDVKGGDLSVEVPSVEVDLKGADIEAQLPEGEVDFGKLIGKGGSAGMKGHLPKVHMPSIKMPKADIRVSKVDITMPSLDLSMPKGKDDIKSPDVEVEGIKVEGDIKLVDKDMHGKDSKFRMPKFKMPSFGLSDPSKEGTASVKVSMPKAEVDVSIPSLKCDVKHGDLNVEVPSVEVDLKGADIEAQLPEGEVDFGKLKGKMETVGTKGHLDKVHMPSIKMPEMPTAGIKGPKVEITMPSVDVSLPKAKLDITSTEVEVERVKVEGDIKLGDKDMHGKDSMFKMPKFKMPSFGVSAPSDEGAASVEVALPKAEMDVSILSLKGDVKSGDLSVEGLSANLDVKGVEIEAQLPEGEVEFGELKGKVGDAGIKGHLPKMHMPSIKIPQMPTADIKGPKVDITMPSVDVSMAKGKADIKSPEVEVEGIKVEGDLKLGDKDMHGKDSKFKMPKFKMPSFGLSAPSQEGAASVEVSLPKAEVDVSIPSLKGDVKGGDLSVEVPSVEVDIKGAGTEAQLPEGEVNFGKLKGKMETVGIKGHLDKVHMPSIKMPTADIKGPKVDVTMPSVDVSLPKGKLDITSTEVEVEGVKIEGDIKLRDKDMHGKDSKFKMPKLKMPSFGVSTPSDDGATSVEVALPKAEMDVSILSLKGDVKGGDLSVKVPSMEVDLKGADIEAQLPEGEVDFGEVKGKVGSSGIKGHLPKVHMPSIKMPKGDIKAPKVDITMPSLDLSMPKGKVDIKSPEDEVEGIKMEGDIKLGDKDMHGKDSKFKMPKFKMPSFGVSAPSKEGETSVEKALPKAEVDVSIASLKGDVKSGDLSVEVPSPHIDLKGADIEAQLPEGEVDFGELKGKVGDAGFKGHLPKMHVPSIKMPQMPKADIKGPKVDITKPSVDMSVPKEKLDIKSPEVEVEGVKVEGDIKVGDRHMHGKDSKFKMPKFQMPSFGVSAPSKEGTASVEVALPKGEVDVSISSLKGDVKGGGLSVEVPSVEVDLKGEDIEAQLPEGEVDFGEVKGKVGSAGIKGHLPKVHMPSIKMPKGDIKAPKADINMPSLDLSMPKGKVDIQSPEAEVEGIKMEGDIKLGDKDIHGKDSKFTIPKFKMPSFGMSAPSKVGAASVEMALPKAEVDVSIPSLKGVVRSGDLSVEVPSPHIDLKGADIEAQLPEGEVDFGELKGKVGDAGFKGHLPKMQVPSIKMLQMPKADIKGPKVDITKPSVDMSLPKEKFDIKSPEVEVEGVRVERDLKVGGKDMHGKDSKFKMPKFQMPSFGVSAPSDEGAASVEVSLPKAEVDVLIPTLKGDVKSGDLSVEGLSSKLDVKGVDVEAQLPEGEVEFGELKGKVGDAGIKGYLPKMHMPSIKMPQMPTADIRGPKVDITMPSVDVSMPKGKVDIKSPEVEVEGVKAEGDIKLGDKDIHGKDSKFKMPKFKMPSFGLSAPSKEGVTSVEMAMPKPEVHVSIPSLKGDTKGGDLTVKVPSVEVDLKDVDIAAQLPEGEVDFSEVKGKAGNAGMKGHLPKVHMPSIKMPKGDIKAPKVDITIPSVDLSMPKGKVDIKSPEVEMEGIKVEGDIKLGDKDKHGKDSKFKMPKFKAPSFGMSAPSKEGAASVEVALPKAEVDVSIPSLKGDVKGGDLNVEVSSVKVDLEGTDIEAQFLGREGDFGQLKGKAGSAGIKGHLPKMHMPSIKIPQMPTADIKEPKVDITMTKGKVDIKSPEGKVEGIKVEGDITLGEKDMHGKDSKFKMPKFKMPSFGLSTPSEEGIATVEVSLPKAEVDVSIPSLKGDIKGGDLSVEVPSVEVDLKGADIAAQLPEGEVDFGELKGKAGNAGIKGYLPKVHIPSIKMPKGDIKAPKVDNTISSVDLSMPKGKVDIKSPEVEVEGDIKLGDKDIHGKDSKFMMPEFKMPSFGVSSPGKEGTASVEVAIPKAEFDVSIPSFKSDVKVGELGVDMPSVEVDLKGADYKAQFPEGEVDFVELKGKEGDAGIRGHLPKVHMPSIKIPQMPTADIKGPKLDITMPSVDVSVPKGKVDIKSLEVKVEGIKLEGDISLGDKNMHSKDSKLKMPSFGVTSPSQEGAASVEVALPKAEVDVSIPSLKGSVKGGDLNVEVSSVEVELEGTDIEAQLPGREGDFGQLKGKAGSAGIKGALPKVHMPSIEMPKMPKTDIRSPKVDITMPSVDVSLPKGKPDITSPEVEMEGVKLEGDIKLGEKDMHGKDGKFKMPKLKMPSFGTSAPSKEGAVSVDMALPKVQVDVAVPSLKGDVKGGDLSVEVPSAKVDVKDVVIEGQLPEVEVDFGELKGKAGSAGIKGHLPKLHMPSIKIPKGDIKGHKMDIPIPSAELSMPKGTVDIKSPEVEVEGIKVEGDIKVGDKDMHGKDGKFKMPKFKMPSFGLSAPSKEGAASVEVALPKAELDASIPSLKGDVKGGNLSVEVPSAKVDVKGVDVKGLDVEAQLPEGEVDFGELKEKVGDAGIKGHLPKMCMPSIKMPQISTPDIKLSKVDVTMPNVDVLLPKGNVSIKSPEVEAEGIKVEEDFKLGEKDMHGKDSKFKVPKFKMPSFGVSAPSKKGAASVEVTLVKPEVDVSIPSLKGDVKGGDLSVEVASVEVDIKGADIEAQLPEGETDFGELKGKRITADIKGHLPKVHMPSIKMPIIPKAEIKSPKVDITMPSVDVSYPKGTLDITSPEVEVQGVKVEGDIKLGDVDLEGKDNKFKMPKFKIPSFGVSSPSKEGAASVEVALSKTEVDVSIPSLKCDAMGGELSVNVPSVEVDLKGAGIEAQMPEGEVHFSELKGKAGSAGIKGELPKVHMPSIKMPQISKADIKSPKMDITMPSVDVSLPKGTVEFKSPELEVEGVKVEGDIKIGDKDMHGKDSKFKMPKFKMPSFGMSAPRKEGAASVEVALPKAELDMSIPSLKGDVKNGNLSVEVPSVEVDLKGADIEAQLPEGEVNFGKLKGKTGSAGIKGDLPKVHMPGIKMPQISKGDIKGPKVDITMPSVDVSLSKGKLDIKSPEVEVEGVKAEGDIKLGDKDIHHKDSKFKMPKFKMPSFGMSASSKDGTASVEVAMPKAELDMSIPSLKGDVKGGNLSVEVPSVEVDLKGADIEAQLPEAEVDFGELKGKTGTAGIKGHLPKVDMPSIKMSKADIKAPKVDITMPSVDMSLPKGKLDIKSPEVEVEGVKAEGDIKLGDKDIHHKDSKFKMPKFKMPSFGVSAPSIEGAASVEVALPKAEVDVPIPSLKDDIKGGDLSVEIPLAHVDVKGVDIEAQLAEGEVDFGELKGKVVDAGFKGHLPKMHVPSIKMPQMPKADIKGPKVDITLPSVDVSLAKGKLDIKSPEVEVEGVKVEGDIKLGDKDVEDKDSKFKMPKFKMPSFGVSAPGKEGSASVEVTLPKAEVNVPIPSLKDDLKGGGLSVEVPSVEDLKGADIEAQLPEVEVDFGELKGKTGTAGIKGHLPKVHMPSIKMSKADIKAPKVDITMPSVDMSLPKGKLDIKSPEVEVEGVKAEGDIKLGDKDIHHKDSKFKMPKFKMPSFGVSAPSKEGAVPVEVALPKAEVDVPIPSLKDDVKGGDLSVEVPSVEVDLKGADIEAQLPEAEVDFGELKGKTGTAGIKGHLPKVHMPSIKISKADIKAPKVDITMPSVDMSLPKGELDIKSPEVELEGVKTEGDIKLGDKDIHHKDSKFKMPKFKMPSFGVSAPSIEGAASLEVALPKAEVDVPIPSLKDDVKGGDLSVEMPSVEVDLKGADIEAQLPEVEVDFGKLRGKTGTAGIKGHLPKVDMPSIEMSKADIRAPKVDITMPSVDVSLPKGKLDIKSPEVEVEGVKAEGDIKLGDKDIHHKDSKFKMPKFKMPSFGVSAPSKEGAPSVDVALPKAEVDMSILPLKGDVKSGDLSVDVPSAHIDIKGADTEAQLAEGEVDFGELKGKVGDAGFKGHFPKVHMSSIKMPKADIKAPKVDITMPSIDVSLPKGKVDIMSPEVELEGVQVEEVIKPGDKEVEDKDSKFKMPKFKMPAFGVSSQSKESTAPVEVILPKAEVDLSIPSVKGDVKSGDLSIEVPSVEVNIKSVDIEAQLPEEDVEIGELKGKVGSAGFKGHLPKVPVPTIKMTQMPKADIKGPKVDITMPSVDVSLSKGKGSFKSPDFEVEEAIVEGDIKLVEKDFGGKSSKFRMPRFKIPSFSSTSSKVAKSSVDSSLSHPDLDSFAPSSDFPVKSVDLNSSSDHNVQLLKDQKSKAEGSKMKLHMPKMTLPSIGFSKGDGKVSKVSLDVSHPEDLHFNVASSLPTPPSPLDGITGETSSFVLEVDTEKLGSCIQIPKDASQVPQFVSELEASALNVSSSKPLSETIISEPEAVEGELPVDIVFSKSSDTHKRHIQFPDVSLPSLSVTKFNISGPYTESAKSDVKGDVTLTKYQVTLPVSGSQDAASFSQADNITIFDEHSVQKAGKAASKISSGTDVTVKALPYEPTGMIKFPKFHKPKFSVSVTEPLEITYAQEPYKVTSHKVQSFFPGKETITSAETMKSPEHLSSIQISADSSVPLAASECLDSDIALQTVDLEVKPESTESEGKEGFFKMPKFKLPSFSWSPKKEADPKRVPESKLSDTSDILDKQLYAETETKIPQLETDIDMSSEKDEPKERIQKPHTVMPKIVLPKVKGSEAGLGLQKEGEEVTQFDNAVDNAEEGNKKISSVGSSDGSEEGTERLTEGTEVTIHMKTGKIPSLAISQPALQAPKLEVGISLPGGEIVPPIQAMSFGQDSACIEVPGASDSMVPSELKFSTQLRREQSEAEVAVEGSEVRSEVPKTPLAPEAEERKAEEIPIEGQESWFKRTKFRMPSFGRSSSKDKKVVLDTEVVQIVVPAAVGQSEIQVPEGLAPEKAITQDPSSSKKSCKDQITLPDVQIPKLDSSIVQVKSHNIHISIPKLEADVSQTFSKADIESIALETETYADVLKRNIDDKGLKLCQTTPISMSESRSPTGENSMPLPMPGLRFSSCETKVPRGETGETVSPKHSKSVVGTQARGEEGTAGMPESERYLLPTEGPIKLKTSSTEIPSQVSVIEMGRVWEGSVLTVKFPKLQVPKFTFQHSNTEADIFIPKVREITCPETDIDIAIHKESPDEWSAKVLKAVPEVSPLPSPGLVRPPKDLPLSSIASPVSKVKVHIQGAHIKSQEVTIESRVTCEHGDLPRQETLSTQIVRASEIPPSDIQTPSYGFSLLKVKIPESHVNLDTTGKEQETIRCTSSVLKMQDISEESLRKDESGADTIDLTLDGDLQPETGEPYEIISSSANLPKLKTFTFEVHSSHQFVDSYSDEEPAEILEFPPEDSHSQTSPDEEEKEPKAPPESQKSSGLFRFWLPNIGFSSSVDDTNSDSKTEISKSVPVETQPEARSDIEPPKKPEKTGWFRFPKLGFSSSPTKKSKSTEESEAETPKAEPEEEAEQTVTFFDARETLSPEEREESDDDAQDPSALVTSSARTELILLEQEGKIAGKTVSKPVAK